MTIPAAWAPLRHADIYLLDHVLRGTISPGDRVLDVGCGSGRHLPLLAHAGCAVVAIDPHPSAVQACQRLLVELPGRHRALAAGLPELDLAEVFPVVLCNAVLHFAPDQEHFHQWADACWRHVAPGGFLFARLSTRIALPQADPPGFTYLATAEDIHACERRWRATRVDPLKTTLVEELRTMTTWTLRKPA